MDEARAMNQRVIGLKCSNGDEYSTMHYIITPFGQSSFIVRAMTGTDRQLARQFMVIPTRAVDVIYMEDYDSANDETSTESKTGA